MANELTAMMGVPASLTELMHFPRERNRINDLAGFRRGEERADPRSIKDRDRPATFVSPAGAFSSRGLPRTPGHFRALHTDGFSPGKISARGRAGAGPAPKPAQTAVLWAVRCIGRRAGRGRLARARWNRPLRPRLSVIAGAPGDADDQTGRGISSVRP
jgi:hypothetical protein